MRDEVPGPKARGGGAAPELEKLPKGGTFLTVLAPNRCVFHWLRGVESSRIESEYVESAFESLCEEDLYGDEGLIKRYDWSIESPFEPNEVPIVLSASLERVVPVLGGQKGFTFDNFRPESRPLQLLSYDSLSESIPRLGRRRRHSWLLALSGVSKRHFWLEFVGSRSRIKGDCSSPRLSRSLY